MSTHHPEESRRFGIREWMSGRWWLALAFSLVVIFALRSGTVGAPAQASVRPLDSLPKAAARNPTTHPGIALRGRSSIEFENELENELRQALRELEVARTALASEKSKVELLQESHEGLEAQFREVTARVRSAAGSRAVPTPIEAIYVIESRETGASGDSH
ncbi:hypothetical protein Poly30_05310 [Planctomycetes bacterium Poly30]|uniref:Uncharacterized protein n=1 Tax=Saltatorellus ferox TaxID=2528018 RepID=A0A518ELR5_9BACT|nr:hypothetical protein Poly30_05310 [Planctomycetes bacterium Poly30]